MDVVYPYCANYAKWEELRYSLRSLANVPNIESVWILGDTLPDWSKGLKLLKSTQFSSQAWIKSRYISQNILRACATDELSDDFLFMCDDFYILKPVTHNQLAKLIAEKDLNRSKVIKAGALWVDQLWHTYDVLKVEGLYGWNYETHMPKIVNKHAFIDMMLLFGYQRGLLWETLYFNYARKGERPEIKNRSFLHQAQFFKPTARHVIDRKMKAAIYLNHSDAGLTENLKNAIMASFPEPSRFEK